MSGQVHGHRHTPGVERPAEVHEASESLSFGEKTLLDYVRAVCNFTKYLGRVPDNASVEDLRNDQLHLVDHGISPASLNAAISELKFFCNVTLDRAEVMQRVHSPRTLPVILSPEEVNRPIASNPAPPFQIR